MRFRFGKSDRFTGLTGVCEGPEGVALAHVVRSADGPPQLVCCDFLSCPQDQERGQALLELIRRHDMDRTRCVGVMPQGSYSLLQVDPPAVPEQEIAAAVCWHIKDLIDFPVSEAIVDYFLVPSRGREDRPKLAYVAAARKAKIQQRAHWLRGGKMKIAAMDIPELAIRNLLTLLPEESKGVACLYLNKDQGLITVSRDGVLYLARNIGIGTERLYSLSGLGSGEGSVDMNPQLQDLLDSIVLEIQRSLDYYGSSFSQPAVAGLMVAPLGREIPELVPYLQSYLGTAVHPLELNGLFEGPDLSPARQAQCLEAIGAALRSEQAGS